MRRLFFFILILAWVSEPFAPVLGAAKATAHQVCSTCGMKGTCGSICCCYHHPGSNASPRHHAPGLYAPGCQPGNDGSSLTAPSLAKWLATKERLFPSFPSTSFQITGPDFIPSPSQEPSTPPPKYGFLS